MNNTSAQQVLDEKLSGLSDEKRELLELLLGMNEKIEKTGENEFSRQLTETEIKLKHIWEQVLNIPNISVADNFFELGGDSIQCIQIVSRSRREGIQISTAQMFEHPTIESLAQVAESIFETVEFDADWQGEMPLLPVQKWFFDLSLQNPHHWNQSILLKADKNAKLEAIEKAWQTVYARHEALGFVYRNENGNWIQEKTTQTKPLRFEYLDLSEFKEAELQVKLRDNFDKVQAGFDLEKGDLFAVSVYKTSADDLKMLVAAHHIAVDGISFRIMLEEFQTAYNQILLEQTISLPPKTASLADWSNKISEFSKTEEIKNEIDYWNNILQSKPTILPRDYEKGENTESSAENITVFLTSDETETLLHKTLQSFRVKINDVLILALTDALSKWTSENEFSIWLEGHGREEIFKNTDISRTVGWFTSIFPTFLKLPETSDSMEKLLAVKDQLARIPRRGAGYGILRNSADKKIQANLLPALPTELVFNYLGKFDGILESENTFSPLLDDCGKLYADENLRPFLIQVVCRIVENRFSATVYYSRNVHKRETIEAFAENFIESLREVVESSRSNRKSELIKTDFPNAKLSDADFAKINGFIGNETENVEDIYTLAPIQEGLLYHSVSEPESGMYLEQGFCDLVGNLDVERFRNVWQKVQQRHSILRTGFIWKSITLPHQIVYRETELPFGVKDLRNENSGMQNSIIEEYLQTDRKKGVDFTKAPLMRLKLFKLAENIHKFIWTIHHLINDSWSTTALLEEVFKLYQNPETDALSAPVTYVNYIEWLKKQDISEAEEIWNKQLQGFTNKSSIVAKNESSKTSEYDRAEIFFNESETVALRKFTANREITLNTLFQAAWGIYLFDLNESSEAVYGGVVSGRPVDLENSENLIGVFINTFPVRLRFENDTEFIGWLKEIQNSQSKLRQYEYLPLKTIQKQCGIKDGENMFDSVLVFQNATADFESMKFDGLEIKNVRYLGFPNYPLTVRVWLGKRISIETLFNKQVISKSQTAEILECLKTLIVQLIENTPEKVSEAVKLIRKNRKNKLQNELGNRRSLFAKTTNKRSEN